MHYYKKNIGDYAKKAGRLSMLQHGAYTLLLDSCYDREVFPTLQDAIEWTWASSREEIEAVEFVLKKFFTLDDGRYVQNRISEELEKYHANSDTNKRIAIEREAKRKEKSTKREPSVDEAPPNHKPRTNNHKPETKNQKPSLSAAPSALDGRFDRFWKAYPKKTGRDAALASFKKRKPDDKLLNEMVFAIGQQKKSAEWLKDGGQFIPNPATWLNQGRWLDEGVELDNANPFAGDI